MRCPPRSEVVPLPLVRCSPTAPRALVTLVHPSCGGHRGGQSINPPTLPPSRLCHAPSSLRGTRVCGCTCPGGRIDLEITTDHVVRGYTSAPRNSLSVEPLLLGHLVSHLGQRVLPPRQSFGHPDRDVRPAQHLISPEMPGPSCSPRASTHTRVMSPRHRGEPSASRWLPLYCLRLRVARFVHAGHPSTPGSGAGNRGMPSNMAPLAGNR